MKQDNELTFNRFLSLIMRCGQMYFNRELSHLNIRAGQIAILRALDFRDGISQEAIRLLFHLDKGTIAKTIKPLVREGYIVREKSPYDKRAYQIFLTDKGREIMPELKTIIKQWADILTTDFTESEKQTIEDLLSRMAENARRKITAPGQTNRSE